MAPKPPPGLGTAIAAGQTSERGSSFAPPSKRGGTPTKGLPSPKNSARGPAKDTGTPRKKVKALAKVAALAPGKASAVAETDRPGGAKAAAAAAPSKPAPGVGATKASALTERAGSSGLKASTVPASSTEASTSGGAAGAGGAKDTKTERGAGGKKLDYLSDDLLARKPLDDKSRDMLFKKSGGAKQEVHFERNENHRPLGRPDELQPSRHERCARACVSWLLQRRSQQSMSSAPPHSRGVSSARCESSSANLWWRDVCASQGAAHENCAHVQLLRGEFYARRRRHLDSARERHFGAALAY